MTAESPRPETEVATEGRPRRAASGRCSDRASGPPADVELREVTKRFGDVDAVDRLSLAVAAGEFLTLLGPSGCGKTTTLRLIGGFEAPTAGEVLIGGEPMAGRPPYRRPVNTVFQHYALFPHLTVAENVGYGLAMAGVPGRERRRRVAEALELVRLPHVGKRKPAALSGGERQRVALARALVNRPAVLLLDEPLGALDPELRRAMRSELRRLNREVGATFVHVTHDQEEALVVSDRIAVMNEGRILQVGSPEEVYERPRSRFVAGFVGQTAFLDGHLRRADGAIAEVQVPGAGLVRARLPDGGPASGAVTVAVRPERLAFADEVAPGVAGRWNALDGAVAGVVYLGTHREIFVRLAGGAIVSARRPNRGPGEPARRAGDPVRVLFDPEAATVLAE